MKHLTIRVVFIQPPLGCKNLITILHRLNDRRRIQCKFLGKIRIVTNQSELRLTQHHHLILANLIARLALVSQGKLCGKRSVRTLHDVSCQRSVSRHYNS